MHVSIPRMQTTSQASPGNGGSDIDARISALQRKLQAVQKKIADLAKSGGGKEAIEQAKLTASRCPHLRSGN